MKAMRSTLTPPPIFCEYEKLEDDGEKGACGEFVILGGSQKFEFKQGEIIPGLERYLTQGECPYQEELRIILFSQGSMMDTFWGIKYGLVKQLPLR